MTITLSKKSVLLFFACMLLSFSSFSQKMDWAFEINSTSSDRGHSIVRDASGNIYVTGSFSGTADFNPDGSTTNNLNSNGDTDVFISKYNSNGDYQMAFSIGGTGTDNGWSIAVDGAGNIYVFGMFEGTVDFDPNPSVTQNITATTSDDYFIAKYNSSGDYQWAFNIGGGQYTGLPHFEIVVDGSSNVYVTARFEGDIDFNPDPIVSNNLNSNTGGSFVAKYNSNGDYQWAFNLNLHSYRIALDAAANIYLIGSFLYTKDFNPDPSVTNNLTSINSYDIFVAKYNTNGNYLSAFSLQGMGFDICRSIAIDASSNIYITGYFSQSLDFNPDPSTTNSLTSNGDRDIFIAKYNNSGAYQWAHNIGASSFDIGQYIAVDNVGNVYVTGQFGGTADFNPDPSITNNLTSNGNDDIFIAKYNTNGVYEKAFSIGGTNEDDGLGIVANNNSQVYVTGYFKGTAVDFNPSLSTTTSLASSSSSDNSAFIASYQFCNGTLPQIQVTGNSNTIENGDESPTPSDHTDFGNFITGNSPSSKTFTINNIGTSDLDISNVNITGTNASDFSITATPSSTIAVSGSSTFTVQFTPNAVGDYAATIEITNTSCNEEVFTFDIKATVLNPSGKRGNMLTLNGTTNYVNINSVADNMSGQSQFTFESWIYADADQAGEDRIIGANTSSGGNVVLFYLEDGVLSYYDGIEYADGADLRGTGWHHVALTDDGTNFKVYLDGVLIGTNSSATSAFSGSDLWSIGQESDAATPGDYFKGKIDEVRIWKTARTLEEIQESMHRCLDASEILSLTDLVAYYQFNDDEIAGTADGVKDILGNHGTLVSGTYSASEVAVGAGVSARQTVNADGIYTFTNTDVSILFLSLGGENLPNGDVVITKITTETPINPSANTKSHEPPVYWIVKNYGTNSNLHAIVKFEFEDGDIVNNLTANHSIHQRGSNEFETADWTDIVPDNVNSADGDNYIVGVVSSFSQFSVSSSDSKFLNTNLSDKRGNMVTLDGSSNYININNVAADMAGVTQFTLEAWISADADQAGSDRIFGVNTSSGGNVLLFYLKDGVLTHYYNAEFLHGSDLRNTGWHHVALTYDGTTYKVYLDGKLIGTTIASMGTFGASNLWSIGQEYDGGSLGDYFKGKIDEVRIWKDVRTIQEIQENKHHIFSIDETNALTNLVAYYQFDKDDEAGVTDGVKDIFGHHGTLISGTYGASEVAIGGGEIATQTVNADGTYTFGNTGLSLTFSSAGGESLPNGNITVTKITSENIKNSSANQMTNSPSGYWVISNYGTNTNLDATIKFSFDNGNIDDNLTANHKVHKRGSNECEAGDWIDLTPTSVNSTGSDDYIEMSVASFSQFYVSSNTSDFQPAPLPVELIAFHAQKLNNHEVELSWTTANELNNQGFEIQRSQDARSWTSIGYTEGQGTTTQISTYSFIDKSPNKGINYYRLQQEDYDGQVEYSAIRTLSFDKNTPPIVVFPNPFHDYLTIENGKGQATIFNLFGQPVKQFIIQNEQSTIDMNDLPSGTYLLVIQRENGERVTFKLVK